MENESDINSHDEENPVLEAIAKARKAQQQYIQTHDVQLEIDPEMEYKSQKKQAL